MADEEGEEFCVERSESHDSEQSPEEAAQAALFTQITELAPHSNGAELLVLAQVYDTVVGKDTPETEDRYIATESTQMLEVPDTDYLTDRRKRGTIGF